MWTSLFQKRWPIAVDIGGDSVKMLQLHKSGGALSILACARWRYPESIRGDEARRNELAITAVRDLLRKEGFRGRSAASALSCEQLTIKSVRLPHLEGQELEAAVRAEAVERLGLDVTSGQLSYLNAGQIRQGNETRDEIIIIAAPRQNVEGHMALLEKMGLSPDHIDAQPVALFRFMERFLRRQADSQAVSVIIDLGRNATRVVAARGRQIIFIKSIEIGGRHLTEAVAKQLHMTIEEAEGLRMRVASEHIEGARQQGSEQAAPAPADPNSLAWTVRDAVRAEAEALAREVNLCLRYCAVTFRGLRADHVTLSGGEAYDPAVAEILKEHLKLECRLAQPLRGIDCSSGNFGSDRRGMLTEWSVCAGLAMRYLDPKESPQEADRGEHRLSA